ncbi:hypothetical protein ACFYRY_13765 [Streptomyces sp. NPDC005263]|uniref:hypothetical protein n=1 Tax=Streptomyces sp. NPDC005263 TaxID=3364711 RepID=UPI0036A20AB0
MGVSEVHGGPLPSDARESLRPVGPRTVLAEEHVDAAGDQAVGAAVIAAASALIALVLVPHTKPQATGGPHVH